MGQQQVLQQKTQITHPLRAGDGHQRVSSRYCSNETRSLTTSEQEMATKRSVAGFVARSQDHLQSEGRDGHQKVSREFVMKQQLE